MKKLILTVTATLACVGAFAQGRVQFVNDSLHLAYYTGGSLDGQAVWANNMPAGITLVADLYLGTSSSSLSLITSTSFSGTAPGKWNAFSYAAPGLAGGTTVFIVAQVRDAAFAAPTTWAPGQAGFGSYYGVSQEFSFVLGTSSSQYPPMYAHNALLGGGLSTWADGTFAMDSVLPNNKGAVSVSAVPEPASFALAGLGVAALTILRRRK